MYVLFLSFNEWFVNFTLLRFKQVNPNLAVHG